MKFVALLFISLWIGNSAFSSEAPSPEGVKSFVREWFALFDHGAKPEEFILRLMHDGLEMRFPNVPVIRSQEDFKTWYTKFRQFTRDPHHTIEWMDVSFPSKKISKVDLTVLLESKDLMDKPVSFLSHQVWTVEEGSDENGNRRYRISQDMVSAAPPKYVAITVDDLPVHGPLPPGVTRTDIAKKMLEVFKKHKVSEVFGFVNGAKVGQEPQTMEVLKLWKDAGYPFGNHTFSHVDINNTPTSEYKKDILANEDILKRISGDFKWNYFRYPFLREGDSTEKRNAIRAYLVERGYKIAQVTIDFEDWSWNAPFARCKAKADAKKIEWLKSSYLKNAEDIFGRADFLSKKLFNRAIPQILLLHIGAFDAEMLDQLLTRYEKWGASFISMKDALKDKVYAMDPAIPAKYGSEFTYQIMKAKGLTLRELGLESYSGYSEDQLKGICL